MINRSNRSKPVELNIVGSSVFGRYPKISIEKTYNMFQSDTFMVPYAGYKSIPDLDLGTSGRAIHTSVKLNKLVIVVDQNVYLVDLQYDQRLQKVINVIKTKIGELQTSTGIVYITENDKPQIVFSDNVNIYYYDPFTNAGPVFAIATKNGTDPLDFVPGYIDFHDTYVLCAATSDSFDTPRIFTNTWRLGILSNNTPNAKLIFPSSSSDIGFLQTKPDNTRAVLRFPSRGNMIFVMGETVTEAWFDVGNQLFPYSRNNSYNIDYGCVNPSTIAATDELVVWLAQNEKSGPIIMASDGGIPKKITTDGIDYLFSNLQSPQDSRAFMYRQDGHLFYHINFYSDNFSLFYDFSADKFYHASDESMNNFLADQVAFFNNQYFFITKKNGSVYIFDTIFTTYDGLEIPRIRICKNIRDLTQQYFVANDVGFTIEMGETPYQQQNGGPIFLITEDGKKLITEGEILFLATQNNDPLITEDLLNLISEQTNPDGFSYLISEQADIINVLPRVDLSISIDGGASFSSYVPYIMNPIGRRKNRLMWWRLGIVNDLVCQFRFYGLGRFVASDGVVNIRQ